MASARAIEAGKAILRVVAVEDGVKAVLGTVTAELERTANRIRNIGLTVTAIGTAGVASLLPAISQAANAEEVISKFETVFGKASDEVRRWGVVVSDEIGRAETKIAEVSASFQDLLVPVGFNQGPAREISKELTKLAFDLASFNNQADADSVRDLQAALTGSSETMKKYGVVVNEAAVKQELLNRNLDPSAASEVEKIQARLAIIYRQTTAAQGDAARTAGSFVNQMKALGAEVQGTAEAIGQGFLPVATGLVSAARFGVKFVGDLVTAIPGLSTAAGVAAGSLAAMGLAVSGFGIILASLLSPVNLAILSIRLLNNATTTFLGISLVAKARTLAWAGAMRVLALAASAAGAAMRTALANPIVLGIGAITLALSALAAAYAASTNEVERFQRTAEEGTVEAAAQAARRMADELERLSGKFTLSESEQRRANEILNTLGDSYNTFGIAVNGVTSRIEAQVDAFAKLRNAIGSDAKDKLQAELEGQLGVINEIQGKIREEQKIAANPSLALGAGGDPTSVRATAQRVVARLSGELETAKERAAELRGEIAKLTDEPLPIGTGEIPNEPGRSSRILSDEALDDIRKGMERQSEQMRAELENIAAYERQLRRQAIEAEINASLDGRDRELALLEEQKKREIEAAEEVGAEKSQIERRFAAERARINKEFDEIDKRDAEREEKKAAQAERRRRQRELAALRQSSVAGTLATRVASQQFGAGNERYQQQSLSEFRNMNETLRKIERKRGGLRAI